jgi:4-aminobutyrate aminotransferase-like enzyme
VTVRDAAGREYLDCLAGAGALALGHHHPVVVEALRRALADAVPLATLDLATPLKDAFVEQSGVVRPAAVVLEPVQGEGGVHPAPAPFAAAVRRASAAADVLVIADEVQTGLGRTGALWASEALGLEPDVLVLSKAIGGGLPLAVIVYRAELDVWAPGAHAGTFRGNQLAMAAGAATIRHMVQEDVDRHAAAVGRRLARALRAECAGVESVAEVRGRGLMLGVELVDPGDLDRDGVPRPDGALAAAVQRGMLERGVIVETGGREGAVIRFLPPLILEAADADRIAAVLVSLRATGRRRLAEMVDRVLALAQHGGRAVAARPELELLAPPSTVTVVFRLRGSDERNTRVHRELFASGKAVLGRTRVGGAVALKLTLLNPLTTPEEVDALIDLVVSAGA